MVNTGPKTEQGKKRKLWTGDGRRRTPAEEGAKYVRDTEKAMKKDMKEASSWVKNRQAKKEK